MNQEQHKIQRFVELKNDATYLKLMRDYFRKHEAIKTKEAMLQCGHDRKAKEDFNNSNMEQWFAQQIHWNHCSQEYLK